VLVQTKEITMRPEDVARVFQSEDFSAAAQKGSCDNGHWEFIGNSCSG